MKKIFNYIIALACATLTLASCADDPVPMASSATTDVESMTFEGQGAAAQTVSVLSDGDWIATAPEWITVVPNFGTGNQTVEVSVADNLEEDGSLAAERKGSLVFSVGGQSATVEILQNGDPDKKPAEVKKITIKEFLDAPESSTVYYELTGTIANIKKTYYGNFDLVDETGSVYVYGLHDKQGGDYGIFETLGLKEGDKLTLRGTKTIYNGLIEVENGFYISHTVSLISVAPTTFDLIPKEGGSVSVKMVSKGEKYNVQVADNDKSWLSIDKIEQQDKDTLVVTIMAQPNESDPRSGSVAFTSSTGENSSTVSVVVEQDGVVAIKDATIKEVLEAPESEQYYRMQGVICKDINPTDVYGNITIKDASGEIYVYGLLSYKGGPKKEFQNLGLKKGDVVTIVGKRSSFNNSPQVKDAYYESHYTPKVVTCAEFLAAPVNSDTYYSVTADITSIVKSDYGNIYIKDASGSEVYVYGVLTGLNGEKQKFETLGLVVGDNITLYGVRAEYNSSPQMGKAYFVSKNN